MEMEIEYETRLVKILDAEISEDFGDEDTGFSQALILLLRDEESQTIFQTTLQEKDIRDIARVKDKLNSKQMIDLGILLRQREEPVKLRVPKASYTVSKEDILESKKLDQPQKRRRYRNRNRKRNQNGERKIN